MSEPRTTAFLAGLIEQPITHGALFEQALTHRSAGGPNNERLEFLGDALLGFVIAAWLWRHLPEADEGALSRARAALVKQEALAVRARALALGEQLRLGSGEWRNGGHERDSILADAFEALLGAYYLDQGFAAAERLILRLFAEPLAALAEHTPGKDPKTRVQEWLQARHLPLPEYTVVAIAGKPHNQHFAVRCRLPDSGVETLGEGTSRRRAEQQAATQMLALLIARDGGAT